MQLMTKSDLGVLNISMNGKLNICIIPFINESNMLKQLTLKRVLNETYYKLISIPSQQNTQLVIDIHALKKQHI